MEGIPQIHWLIHLLVNSLERHRIEPVVVVFRMNFKWNFKYLKSKSTLLFPFLYCENHTFSCLFRFLFKKSLNYICYVMLQNQWPQFVQTTMESRTFLIFSVFDHWWGHVIKGSLHSWSVNIKSMKLVVLFWYFARRRLTKYRNYTTHFMNIILNDHSCKILFFCESENLQWYCNKKKIELWIQI